MDVTVDVRMDGRMDGRKIKPARKCPANKSAGASPAPSEGRLFWFVQARPRPYFFGAGIVGAYFLLAQQNSGTGFSTLEKIWSRSISDIQTRPRAPLCTGPRGFLGGIQTASKSGLGPVISK